MRVGVHPLPDFAPVVVGALVLAFLGRGDVGDAFKVPETAVRRLKAETI